MVSGLKSKNYSDRLKELKMITLSAKREELDMTEMSKIVTGKSAVNSSVWFGKVKAEGMVTKQVADPLNVKIPAARLELRKNFFSVRVSKEWTSIPSDIKNSKNARSFLHAYRRHLGYYPSQAHIRPREEAN